MVVAAAAAAAAALVVAAVAGFVIYRNQKKAKEVRLKPLVIKQSPAAVPTSQCCQ